jgi:hypothetical protein
MLGELVTLKSCSFQNLTRQPGNPILVRMISYLIMMTPSIVVCSAYPLCAITLVTNLFLLITGKISCLFTYRLVLQYTSVPKLLVFLKIFSWCIYLLLDEL